MQNHENNNQIPNINLQSTQQQLIKQGNPFLHDVTKQKNYTFPVKNQSLQNKEQVEDNKDYGRVSSSSQSSRSSISDSNQQKWEYESIKENQQIPVPQEVKQTPQSDIISPKQPEKHRDNRIIRYKYCCKKCKHADRDKDKKACVCVVPRDQRRTHLGCEGCQTCGCTGCSKEDFIFRGEDPEYNPDDRKKQTKKKQQQRFEARNGCCKSCMKAFSKSGKSCICQVPEDVRKTKLSSTGCKICGCVGCNPQDRKGYKTSQKRKRSRSRSERRKQKRDRHSKSKEKKRRSKSRSPQIIDTFAMNFHNIDRSIVGSMIINEYQIDPALLGFGIPQRSSSYLFGSKN